MEDETDRAAHLAALAGRCTKPFTLTLLLPGTNRPFSSRAEMLLPEPFDRTTPTRAVSKVTVMSSSTRSSPN
ncbi:hypothetical protein LUX05_04240 [Streptomyces somaliensis]|nr:hypothetical protein [Streptomyces somaliensis]